jgi:hypothetical protein
VEAFIFRLMQSHQSKGANKIMDSKKPLISCSLATMAGICFMSGIAILSSEGRHVKCTSSKTLSRC